LPSLFVLHCLLVAESKNASLHDAQLFRHLPVPFECWELAVAIVMHCIAQGRSIVVM